MKLAFEVNGTFWHSIEKLPIDYHAAKSELCELEGIRLIHLHEHNWPWEKHEISSYLKDSFSTNINKFTAPRDFGLKRILESKGFERIELSEPNKILDGSHIVYDSGTETWYKNYYK